VKVYERAGFHVTGRRIQPYRDRKIETIHMERTF
jgi:hypothetical protein